MIEYPTVISPCTATCRLDNDRICMGCFRSIKEIRAWYESPNEVRQQFKDNAEARKLEKQRDGQDISTDRRDVGIDRYRGTD